MLDVHAKKEESSTIPSKSPKICVAIYLQYLNPKIDPKP